MKNQAHTQNPAGASSGETIDRLKQKMEPADGPFAGALIELGGLLGHTFVETGDIQICESLGDDDALELDGTLLWPAARDDSGEVPVDLYWARSGRELALIAAMADEEKRTFALQLFRPRTRIDGAFS